MKKSLMFVFSILIIASMVLGACAKTEAPAEAPAAGEKLAVGIVLPTKDEPRWIQDETRFKDALQKAGHSVEILFSQGDSAKEKQNVETLISKGVKVLIICPHDSTAAAASAEAARAAGVKVVSYDRLITDTDAVDYYVTFDSVSVGAAQGQYLVDHAEGKGNPLYLYAGAASDNNAFLFFEGAWNVLQPKIADGTFVIKNSPEAVALQDKATLTRDEMGKIIGQITTNWDFNVAKTLAESNLTAAAAADKGKVFILAPNDGTARAIADAFAADTAVTKYFVTGQDAEVASVQYIIDGKQSMTVLKDVRTLVSDAIKAAVAFLEGKKPEETTTYNNGVIDVPAKPSAVVSVDKANVKAAIVDSGYYKADQFTGLEEGATELGPVLKIGQIGMMSGSMALYGLQQQRGFELGLEYMSGGKKDDQGRWIIANRPVEVIVKDDEGNPEKAVALALELIEKDGVELLQGPVSSASAAALTTVALENKIILMVDPAASYFTTGKYFNPYVFRTARTSFDDTLIIAKYLVENVGPTFAHIGVDNAFGQASGAALKYSVEKFGGELVADIYAPFETTDFTPYIQQAMDSGAENLFLTWSGTGYVTLFQGLSDMGALDTMTVGTGFGDNASFTAVFGEDVLGTVGLNVYHYTAADNAVNNWLVEHHVAKYKDAPDGAINAYPDLFTAGGMASAIALATALEKTGGDTSGEAMIPALEGLIFEGPKGTYHIRPEDHVCEQPMNILKLVNLNPDLDGDGINEYRFFETIYVSKYNELGVPCTLEGEYAARCGSLPTLGK